MSDAVTHEEVDNELREIERELCRLPEVNAARIVGDDVGRPIEVHIVATPAKHPKQIVRDIQSVVMASFGLELDRRLVSVVQLEESQLPDAAASATDPPAPESAEVVGGQRVTIAGITAEQNGLRTIVRVTLGMGGVEGQGFAEGSVASSARPRLAAQAALDALRQLAGSADRADVEVASVVRAGARDVAICTVVFVVPPYEEVVSGSALVRNAGETEAIVRSVLDATNRRLQRLQVTV